mgnify:CR=1 FL=1
MAPAVAPGLAVARARVAGAAPVAAADATPDKDDETQQTRVLTYMGISILPLLALVPFLGSRDFLPADPSLYS